jgi:uncharacterized membrane protein (DUF485 family)
MSLVNCQALFFLSLSFTHAANPSVSCHLLIYFWNFAMDLHSDTIKHEDMPKYLGTQDPVVLNTSWETIKNSGQPFKTHELIKTNDDRIEFTTSLTSIFLDSFIMLVGIIIIFFSLFISYRDGSVSIGGFIVGLLFIGFSITMFYISSKKSILDKNIMAFWRSRKKETRRITPHNVEEYRSLNQAHAVQLIKKYVCGTPGSGCAYYHEINLVFDNGERINFVNHTNHKAITIQAKQISEFLNIPLWDGRTGKMDVSKEGWYTTMIMFIIIVLTYIFYIH